MALSSKLKQQLRAQAHSLKPIVMLGNHGLTDAVQAELERALTDHALIKIRISTADRPAKRAILQEICTTRAAELIQTIGNIGVIYRKRPDAGN